MIHSLSAQVSYYSKLIQKNPTWQYVGAYVDEAKTGTKDLRPEFQRLLKDCKDGKIDMIITKSISRFARNTLKFIIKNELLGSTAFKKLQYSICFIWLNYSNSRF